MIIRKLGRFSQIENKGNKEYWQDLFLHKSDITLEVNL